MSDLQFWHHHGGVSVPDLDAAIAWYSDVLGFSVEGRFHIPTIPADVAMMVNGDLRMELFEVPGAASLPEDRRIPDHDLQTHGNKHVSFLVRDIDSFGEELKRRGADIVWIKKFDHGANIFLRDNSGNLIEFVQGAPPTGRASTL